MAAVIIYYAVLLISIPLYYKIRKIRQPFTKWGGYKDDVSLGEAKEVAERELDWRGGEEQRPEQEDGEPHERGGCRVLSFGSQRSAHKILTAPARPRLVRASCSAAATCNMHMHM